MIQHDQCSSRNKHLQASLQICRLFVGGAWSNTGAGQTYFSDAACNSSHVALCVCITSVSCYSSLDKRRVGCSFVNEQRPAYFALIAGFCLLHNINHFPHICCQVSHQLTITAVACFVSVVANATEAHPVEHEGISIKLMCSISRL